MATLTDLRARILNAAQLIRSERTHQRQVLTQLGPNWIQGHLSPDSEHRVDDLLAEHARLRLQRVAELHAIADEAPADVAAKLRVAAMRFHDGEDDVPDLLGEVATALQAGPATDPKADRRADSKTDARKESGPTTPANPDVAKLAKRIRDNPDSQRTKIDIAREFTNNDETKANSLLRRLRSHPHLLNRPDGAET
jgi:hypothetical protein